MIRTRVRWVWDMGRAYSGQQENGDGAGTGDGVAWFLFLDNRAADRPQGMGAAGHFVAAAAQSRSPTTQFSMIG